MTGIFSQYSLYFPHGCNHDGSFYAPVTRTTDEEHIKINPDAKKHWVNNSTSLCFEKFDDSLGFSNSLTSVPKVTEKLPGLKGDTYFSAVQVFFR
jgi:hypothetical protein